MKPVQSKSSTGKSCTAEKIRRREVGCGFLWAVHDTSGSGEKVIVFFCRQVTCRLLEALVEREFHFKPGVLVVPNLRFKRQMRQISAEQIKQSELACWPLPGCFKVGGILVLVQLLGIPACGGCRQMSPPASTHCHAYFCCATNAGWLLVSC
eukprot:3016151-Amphidinium_carterae.1